MTDAASRVEPRVDYSSLTVHKVYCKGLFCVIEGKLEGNAEGKQEFLLTALESKFSVPSELKEKIMSETDIEKLNLWFQLSLKVSSLEEFEQNM